jgi:hypothetical protein
MTANADRVAHGPVAPGPVAPAAAGYSPRHTLPFRVEVIRQLRRRRTMVAFLILLVLPWILVGAFELGGPPDQSGGAPGLVDLATTGGLNFAAFSFFASAGFLLVVAVALFCGDTVSSEASWASLRYLLAAPVPRARLLRQKLAVALTYATVAVVSFPAMSLLAGTVVFGWHPLRLPATGVEMPDGTALARLGIVLVYVLITELVVAGLHRLAARRGRRRGGACHRQQHPRRGDRAGFVAGDLADALAVRLAGRVLGTAVMDPDDRGCRGVGVLRAGPVRAGVPPLPNEGHRLLTVGRPPFRYPPFASVTTGGSRRCR